MKKNITNKDVELLDYLLKVRVATIYQIKRDINEGRAHTYLTERLSYLHSLNYIKKDCHDFKRVYSLGSRGIKYFKEKGIIMSEYKPAHLGFNASSATHDLLLTDIHALLSKIEEAMDLKTHNLQMILKRNQHQSHNISDFLFWVKKGERTHQIALEVELSRKNPRAYKTIFGNYHGNKQMGIVLYLVPKEAQKRELLSIDKTIYAKPKSKIMVGLLDSFLSDPKGTFFQSWFSKSFSFQTITSECEEAAIYDLTFDTKQNFDRKQAEWLSGNLTQ